MFPSSGYFKIMKCPQNEGLPCNRPYCHFHHISNEDRKIAAQENDDESLQVDNGAKQSKANNSILTTEQCRNKLETVCDKNIDPSVLLNQVLSEAVKKAISENPILSQSFSKTDLISNADATIILKNAVNNISYDDFTKPKNDTSVKQHNLYLPPPGTPSYNPTPISQLKQKIVMPKVQQCEYTPTSIATNKVLDSKNIEAEFSPVEEDERSKADFDILEQVLAESSSNPHKVKALNDRKLKLRKERAISFIKFSDKIKSPRKDNEISKILKLNTTETSCEVNFNPPSPVFQSSADIPSYSSFSLSKPNESTDSEPHQQSYLVDNNSLVIPKPSYSNNKLIEKVKPKCSHSMLPQIAHLSCPPVKNYIPIVKVAPTIPLEYSAVEELLQELDGGNEVEISECKEQEIVPLNKDAQTKSEENNKESEVEYRSKSNKRKHRSESIERSRKKRKSKYRSHSKHSKKRKRKIFESSYFSSSEIDSSVETYKRRKHKKHRKSSKKSKKYRSRRHGRSKHKKRSSESQTRSSSETNSDMDSEHTPMPVALCDIKVEKNIDIQQKESNKEKILPNIAISIKKEGNPKPMDKKSFTENRSEIIKDVSNLNKSIESSTNNNSSSVPDSGINISEYSRIIHKSDMSLFDMVALSIKKEKPETHTSSSNSIDKIKEHIGQIQSTIKMEKNNEPNLFQQNIIINQIPSSDDSLNIPTMKDINHNKNFKTTPSKQFRHNSKLSKNNLLNFSSSKHAIANTKSKAIPKKHSHSCTNKLAPDTINTSSYSLSKKNLSNSNTTPSLLSNSSYSASNENLCSSKKYSVSSSQVAKSSRRHSNSSSKDSKSSSKRYCSSSKDYNSAHADSHSSKKKNSSFSNKKVILKSCNNKDSSQICNESILTNKTSASDIFGDLLSSADTYPSTHNSKKKKKIIESKRKYLDKKLKTLEIGSPIPDLSALDEIDKEDWDQLLSENTKSTEFKEYSSDDDMHTMDQSESYLCENPDSTFDSDEANDPKVMQECFQMFSNYNSEENNMQKLKPKTSVKQSEEKKDSNGIPSHQRNARIGAKGNLLGSRPALKRPFRKSPAEVMLERYKKLKDEEAALQKKLADHRSTMERTMNNNNLQLESSSPSISSSTVSSSSDVALPADQHAVSTSGYAAAYSGKKRIARAPSNVVALMNSKSKLMESRRLSSELSGPSSKKESIETIATTNPKGTKRVAHMPTKIETLTRPVIVSDGRSKVPQNIRQRYLNTFIEETKKFCESIKIAYEIAVAEENICHERASNRMVYLNVAVNTIKRLRNQQVSEGAQEKTNFKDSSDICDPKEESVLQMKKLSHPLNPNHKKMTHFSVMASGGQKGSWSIESGKKSNIKNFDHIVKGPDIYKYLKKYILSVEELGENGYPCPDPNEKGKAIIIKINFRKKVNPSDMERICARCSVPYKVDEYGIPLIPQPCVYHWGRFYKTRGRSGFESKYSCCQSDNSADGCCLGDVHVSDNYNPDALHGFVHTFAKENAPSDVFSLDCEMCYTTEGNELTRITVINSKIETVYETLVLPDNPIIDYNTRFSGITAEDMKDVTVSLRDVQAALLSKFSSKTILMGHSLESDFLALKLIHNRVIDTSLVFPHKLGPPYKRALKNLASELLNKLIQNDVGGHDSAEDAITCIELMQWKVKEDLKLSGRSR